MSESSALQLAWDQAVAVALDSDLKQLDRAFVRQAQPIALTSGVIIVAVPSEVAKDSLEKEARDIIIKALTEILQQQINIAVMVDPSLDPAYEEPVVDSGPIPIVSHQKPTWTNSTTQAESSTPAPTSPPVFQPRPNTQVTDPSTNNNDDSRLNEKYTFDTFVIGSSNRFAGSAAFAVAEQPGSTYNPLFIYGGSGLGKTHLLHAIGNLSRTLWDGIKVKYVNSEEFTNDFINSIRDDKAESFQRRYRQVDVLLIDDIQFLQGKEQTMEEFFHTFNTLHNDGKQIVITSDLPPKFLDGFEARLRSRFEWDLIVDVQPPDLETRIAILRKKASADNLNIPDPVLDYIGSKISTNIRELEGALVRVSAFANLTHQKIDLGLAEVVLKDIITETDDKEITPALIVAETADYFDITIEALFSADRSRHLTNPRQISMYLCRELTDLSLPQIGQLFGGRDHSTVIYAVRKITSSMSTDPKIYASVSELTNFIKQKSKN